jgi:hypothetical protein
VVCPYGGGGRALGAARELGHQADDRTSLGQALDKLAALRIGT